MEMLIPLSILEGNGIQVNYPSMFKCTDPVFSGLLLPKEMKEELFPSKSLQAGRGEATSTGSRSLSLCSPSPCS